MDIFVILVSALFASVKSDIGLGYQYSTPATSYDVPFGSVGNLDSDRKYYHVGKQNFRISGVVPTIQPLLSSTGSVFGGDTHLIDNLSPTISSLVSTPIHGQDSFVERQNFRISNLLPTTPASILETPIRQHTPFVNIQSTQKKTSYVGKSVPGKQLIDVRANTGINDPENLVNVGSNAQNVEVQKHLYFYSAPEEPEEIRSRVIAPAASPKKNVKILFIKAPTFKFAPVHIPSQVQNDEKTLVYVLVKKPDEPEHIIIPTSAPTKPTKPEVYFIKYKSQKEADDAIYNIQNHGSETGGHDTISRSEYSEILDSRVNTQDVHKSDINQDNLVSRILPIPSGVLPSNGDFSNLNVNNGDVYNGLRKGNAEISATFAPDTRSEQFSTVTNLVNEKINKFDVESAHIPPRYIGAGGPPKNLQSVTSVYGEKNKAFIPPRYMSAGVPPRNLQSFTSVDGEKNKVVGSAYIPPRYMDPEVPPRNSPPSTLVAGKVNEFGIGSTSIPPRYVGTEIPPRNSPTVTSVDEKVDEFGIGSTPINLPTRIGSVSDGIRVHEVYGPPQRR